MAKDLKLITLKELQEAIQMSEVWIRRRVNDEKDPMPHHRFGKSLRFYLPKVLDWAEYRYREKK